MFTVHTLQKKYFQLKSLDFDLLLAHALHQPREFLYTHPHHRLSLRAYCLLLNYLWQYQHGYSVAAITHHKEFYGLDFYVNKHALIPRPETEVMVENVIERIKNQELRIKNTKIVLIDVGTGSGCIPIAILKTIEQSNNRTMKQLNNETIKTYATDISHKTLRVARHNARTQNVFINFFHGNLLEPVLPHIQGKQQFAPTVVVTANLPYLTKEQFNQEPSIQKEPYHALVAGKQGLALYEGLLKQIQSLLNIIHSSFFILLEIDPSQSEAITKLINQLLPQAKVEIKTDLARRDRVAVIRINS